MSNIFLSIVGKFLYCYGFSNQVTGKLGGEESTSSLIFLWLFPGIQKSKYLIGKTGTLHFFKNFLRLFVWGIILYPTVRAASEPLEETIVLPPVHRATGYIRESSINYATRERLIALGATCLHDSHPKMLAMLASPPVPSSYDLSPYFPPVFDQGSLGSCVANALIGAVMYNLIRQGVPNPNMRSRLYLYYYARYYCGLDFDEDLLTDDSGSTISNGILALVEKGVCLESSWPYYDRVSVQPNRFKDVPLNLDTEAGTCKLFIDGTDSSIYSTPTGSNRWNDDAKTSDELVPYFFNAPTATTIKNFLASGVPVVCGFTCYNSTVYYMEHGGVVPVPPYGQQDTIIGGHAVVFVGYSDTKVSPFRDGKTTPGYFLMRNSWGPNTGDPNKRGHFWLPYEFLTLYNTPGNSSSGTLVDNCWTIGSAGSLAGTIIPTASTPVDPIAQLVSGGKISAPSGGDGPMIISSTQILPYPNLFTNGVQINNSRLTIGSAAALGIDKQVEFASGDSTLITTATMTLELVTKTAAATLAPATGTSLIINTLLGTGDLIVKGETPAATVVLKSALPAGNYTVIKGVFDCTASSTSSLSLGPLILQSSGTLKLPAGAWAKSIVLF